jgi:peptidoglycan/xylan/chitin deacetylase (PgdA/CDA1 family)
MKDKGLPPAYGFVNGSFMEHEPGTEHVLEAWRAAGLPLGNHTWSHMNLNSNSLEAWEQDLTRNEPLLRRYAAGADWHWIRYPNLAEGRDDKRTPARSFLKAQGYHIASVTMSFGDYAWNAPYARCVERRDDAAIAQLEETYLKAADDTITYTRAASKAALGREIPYVLLMHVGALDAKLLPRLLALYQQRGFRFVTLEEAESDPFYASDRNIVPDAAPATIEAAAAARGIALPSRPLLPKMDDLCK